MSEISCVATISEKSIVLDLDGISIPISLDGDLDFTPLAKNLTRLIERESSIDITWAGTDEPVDKAKVAQEVVNKIIESFNEVIEENFDGEDENL